MEHTASVQILKKNFSLFDLKFEQQVSQFPGYCTRKTVESSLLLHHNENKAILQ